MADVIKYKYQREDGSTYYGDVRGNPITSETSAEVQSVGGSGRDVSEINMGTSKSSLEAPTWKDYAFQYGGKYVPESLAQIGGMVGALTKNPRYAALGTAVGSALGSELKRADPEIFGEYNANQEGVNALLNQALDPVLRGVSRIPSMVFPSARQELYGQLASFFKPRGRTPEVMSAIKADPTFEHTVGQTNPFAKFLEDLFSAKNKQAIVAKQEANIAKEVLPHLIETEPAMRSLQKQATGNIAKIHAKKDTLYRQFDPAIDYTGNAKTVLKELPTPKRQAGFNQPPPAPKYETKTLVGAIPINHSKRFADTLGSQIDEILKDPAVINSTPGLQLHQIRQGLNSIRGIETYLDPVTKKAAPTYGEYRKLKETRDALSNFVESDQYVAFKDKLGGSLTYLRDALARDIDEGVKGWGPNAYKRYRAAQDYAKFVATKIDSKLTNELLYSGLDPDRTLTKVADKMLSDPQFTRQAVLDLGSREPVSKLFMNKLYRSSYDQAAGVLDTDKALKFLGDNQEIAKIALPSRNLSEVKRFLYRNSVVGPYSEGMNIGKKLRMGAAGISLGVGLGDFVAGGHLPIGAKTAVITLAGSEGAKMFTDKVLLDPKMARIATGQLDVSDKSTAAKAGTAALLSALKTAQVYIMTPKGKQRGHINNQGKIVFDESSPADSNNQ